MTAETAHVHLQTGQEHDVIDAHLTEEHDAVVTVQHMKPVGTHEQTRQDEPYDMGHTQAAQHDGCQQDN